MRWSTAISLFAATASALDAAGWRSQSIYQVLTDRFARTDGSTKACDSLGIYCGGTFQGLIKKLDYIQDMGFTAIWISPVIANWNTDTPYGKPYHGYWPLDNYKINSNFGTAADLVALSKELHSRNMYLMVDVVPNHMAFNGAPSKIDYSKFNPFNDKKYFHSTYCPIDYNNDSTLTNCWMGDQTVSLPDIKSEDSTVQSMWNSWVKEFVANYTIDGLRVDSAMQIQKSFFPDFVTAGGVYQVGEVMKGNPNDLCDYQNYMPAMLNYVYYFWIKNSFSAGGSMQTFSNNIGWLKSTCADVTVLPVFIENHDQARWPSFVTDASLISNAIAFTIMSDGIPLVYYGQEQGFSGAEDPKNRETMWTSNYDTTTALYKLISSLNNFRNYAVSLDSAYASKTGSTLYSDATTLVRKKGSSGKTVISIWTNDGAKAGSRSLALSTSTTGFGANIGFTDIVSCTVYTTDSSGNLQVTIKNGMPLVLYHTNGLTGSSICSSSSKATTTSASASVAPVRVVDAATSTTAKTTSTSTAKTTTTSKVASYMTSTASAKTTSTTKIASFMTSTIKTSTTSTKTTSTTSKTTSTTAKSSSTSTKTTVSLSTSPASPLLSTSTTNKCGATYSLTCLGVTDPRGGTCCSRYNNCGQSADYCCPQRFSTGGGCQGEYGECLAETDLICVSQATKTGGLSTKAASTTTSKCTPPTSVPVAFSVNATTTWGQSVYLTGSIPALNSWDTDVALSMNSDNYPLWTTTLTLDVGEDFEYKFIKADGDSITWESGDNREYTVPSVTACSVSKPVATIGGVWKTG